MKTIKKLGLLIAVIAMSSQAFAYKLIKIRDHWGVWGGFSAVQQLIDGHQGPSGEIIIDVVTLRCSGWGNESCCYSAIPVDFDGEPLSTANIGILNGLFSKAEDLMEKEHKHGSITETHALQKRDGSFRYMQYIATWDESQPDVITVDINETEQFQEKK